MKKSPQSTQKNLPSLGEALDFLRLLWEVDQSLQQNSKAMARQFSVTAPQRLVIRIVGQFPGIIAGDLSKCLHLHPSTMTGILARLAKQRFILRKPDAVDKRKVHIWLTDRGKSINKLKQGTVEQATKSLLKKTSKADRQATERVLQLLVVKLQKQLA